jgi:hypothetical protein
MMTKVPEEIASTVMHAPLQVRTRPGDYRVTESAAGAESSRRPR